MTTEQYDCLILGSGQAGGPLATALANAGRKTALIEREHVGGTCINEGCTPTKTMVASARVAYLARRGGDYGVDTGPDHGRYAARAPAQTRHCRQLSRNGSEQPHRDRANLDLIYGEASFTGPKTVRSAERWRAPRADRRHIFINAGSGPRRPIAGLDPARTLTPPSIMELDERT